MGTRLAPDTDGLGPFTKLEKADAVGLFFGIWTVGNVMPCLTAVETGPSIVVVGGDLDYIALRGLHGVLVLELCVRGLGAHHLGLGPILH